MTGSTVGIFSSGGLSKPVFRPTRIPNMIIWYDATDSSTLFQDVTGSIPAISDNDPVRHWKNKASDTYHANIRDIMAIPSVVKLVGDSFTINTKPTIKFTSDASTSTNSLVANFIYTGTQLSVFIVSKRNTANENYGLMSIYRFNNWDFWTNTAFLVASEKIASPGYIFSMRNNSYFQHVYPAIGVPFIFNTTLNCDNQTGYSWLNGNLATTNPLNRTMADFTGNLDSDRLEIGGRQGNYCDSNIGEVLVFTRELNQTERKDVLEYLSMKWNISTESN